MELAPETLLNNRYRIINLLGQGGMGAVYLAYDTSLEHQVAVKLNRNTSPEATTQFLREARLLATLRHPNLPRVIDYFIISQNQYLVMDYIPGKDLGTLLEEERRIPLDQVLQWAEQLGSALRYMHTQNPQVIHRDIKPGNIKLTPDGEVILVDFGIAKASETSQATATGASGYTPGFAPPEQYGAGRTGPYSDQYSLAATLYNLLTGEKPAESVQRVLGEATLIPIQQLIPTIPLYVDSAIQKALSIRPDERFASVDQLIQAMSQPASDAAQTVVGGQATMRQPALDQATMVARPTYAQTQVQPAARSAQAQPVSQEVAPPVVKASSRHWGVIGGGVGLLVILVIVAAVVFSGPKGLFAPVKPTETPTQTLKATATATIVKPSDTPLPPAATATMIPSSTLTPTPPPASATPEPSATPPPQATPTNTPIPLGKGGSIAFVSDRADGKTLQVWTMRVALDTAGALKSSDFKQITSDGGDKHQPYWSPDGKKLVYVAPGSNKTNGQDIWLLDLGSGKNPVNLTNKSGDDSYPVWSPDGKQISFTNQRDDGIRQVFVMNPDGSNQIRLSLDYIEYAASWSPKMDWLLYVIYAKDHNWLYWRNREFQYKTPQPFDPQEVFGQLGEVTDPIWSPDGSQIAYVKTDKGYFRIYTTLVSSRGSISTMLTKDQVRERAPAWSPDSQWIVFTSGRDNNNEIYVMTSTGLLQTNLTNAPGKDMEPNWQPQP